MRDFITNLKMNREAIHLLISITVIPLITSAGDLNNSTVDPCYNYSVLNDSWRSVTDVDSGHDDILVAWNGWYRLYLQNQSAQLPEGYGAHMLCGGYTALVLGESHPLPQDGIVTRNVYGVNHNTRWLSYYISNPVEVKACPGEYYVYRLVTPSSSMTRPTYCAVPSYDPCSNYTVLDQPWRATNVTSYYTCDNSSSWNGWYRMFYHQMDVRMPESCVSAGRCGTDIPLWLSAPHPQIQDGIVTRLVCGTWSNGCCTYSTSIRVKACAGGYYVYEFVSPNVCNSSYCADVNLISTTSAPTTSQLYLNNSTVDPCYNYSVLNDSWRSVTDVDSGHDDILVAWNGWYQLYLQNQSAQLPEGYGAHMLCGGYTALVLGESHPLPQDGIVTRNVYGVNHNTRWLSYYISNPVQVKACPGEYYVYRLVTPSSSMTRPTYCAVPSYDPCSNYTVLDQPWRATNATSYYTCDNSSSWNGWYRMFYQQMDVRMPESCVSAGHCGTDIPLWLSAPHPQIQDGIVTRLVCGTWSNGCCTYSTSIRVKACAGGYYVYEFVSPNVCNSSYCADVNTESTTTPPTTMTPKLNLTQTFLHASKCRNKFTAECGANLLNLLQNLTDQVLPPKVVENLLGNVLDVQNQFLTTNEVSPVKLVSYANSVMNVTEKLVSTLVASTQTNYSVKIAVSGLDVYVFAVGSRTSLNEIPELSVSGSQMDIDLIKISKNNNGSAAVAFMSYANMSNMLKPSLFITSTNTVKTMVSSVVSATLPKTTNTQLTKPVNFTLKHNQDVDPKHNRSCVYWKETEWVVDGCIISQTNRSYTVCSCVHLSTFALIMQTSSSPPEDDSNFDLFNTVAVVVGLVFLSLTLLTFALCRKNPKVINTALINLCISLLLAHLLFLLTQQLLSYIQPNQVVCAALAGILHFLFLSAFVWMFIDAVLLFISVKNLSKIKSLQSPVVTWKCLIIIGYTVPLVLVSVSAGLFHEGYGSTQCWIKQDEDFVWSFLGPVCFILVANTVLFGVIMVTIRVTLGQQSASISQIKQTRIILFKALLHVIILGCPWILGFFLNKHKVLEIVFLFFNSQQGTFIFLVHCATNQEVKKEYRKLFCGRSSASSPKNPISQDSASSLAAHCK